MAVHYERLTPDRPAWLGGGQWILPGLRDVTVLFGRNGSGKSILLRKLLEDEHTEGTHYTSPERAGEIRYDHNVMQQELDPKQRGQQRRGKNFDPQFRRETVSRLGSLQMTVGSKAMRGESDGRNLQRDIESELNRLLPEFKFNLQATEPYWDLHRIGEIDEDFRKADANQLSSGEAEAFTLALDLLTVCHIWVVEGQRQRLILIDEPDTHLHPDLQLRLAEFIVGLTDAFDAQIILATHSTTLLAGVGHFGREKVGVVYLDNGAPQQRVIPFGEAFERLATCLGGHALLGPLFAAPLLLVEGDDDYRIWSEVPRHPGYRGLFAVIPCDGGRIKEYQQLLERLLGSLRDRSDEPAGFALLDGDVGRPSNQPQEHVKFLQLVCHEAENLYLTDQVLNRIGPYTWDDAQQLIKENAAKFGDKSEKLTRCNEWDRRSADIKDVIDAVAQILDPKGVLWTARVGQVMGRGRPVGDLAEFLGNEVMEALWT